MPAFLRTHLSALLIILLGVSRVSAAPPPANAAFISQFDQSHQILLYLPDPLPRLDAVVSHPALLRVLQEGKLADLRGKSFDLVAARRQLQNAAPWIPDEIAVGLPQQGLENIDHFVQAWLLAGLAYGAIEAGDDEINARLPAIHAALVKELAAAHPPSVRIWARFRKSEQTNIVFSVFGMYIAQFAGEHNLPFTSTAEQVAISASLGDVLIGPDGEDVSILFLELMGIAREDDPHAAALGEAVRKLGIHLRLSRKDGGLLLDIQPAETDAPPLTVADLGPMYQPGPGQLAWGRWDIARLKSAGVRWAATWDEYADTPAGEAVIQADTDDLINTMLLLTNHLAMTAPTGELRVWAEQGIRAQMIEHGAVEAVDLRQHPAAGMIPADTDFYTLDGTISFADQLASGLAQLEDRIASRELSATLTGNLREELKWMSIAEAYYGSLGDFRTQIYAAAPPIFEIPTATIVRDGATIDAFKMTFNIHDHPVELAGRDLPFIELAFVASTSDRASAIKWLGETNQALANGLTQYFHEHAVDPQLAAVQPVDLGLAVSAHSINLNWILKLVPAEAGAVAESSGEFALHAAEAGDLLIISNSPRLTRDMLAARDDATRRLAIRESETPVVLSGATDGRTVARLISHTVPWITMLGDGLDAAAGSEESAPLRQAAKALTALEEIGALITGANWHATQDGDVRQTHLVIEVQPE